MGNAPALQRQRNSDKTDAANWWSTLIWPEGSTVEEGERRLHAFHQAAESAIRNAKGRRMKYMQGWFKRMQAGGAT